METSYKISSIIPANEVLLMNDVYLVLLYATRIPPHLLISINGKIFTLSVKGATVDGNLFTLLTFIRKRNIETIFIKLALPQFFTMEQLKNVIRKCTLFYPCVDIGFATCLAPIRDFCHSVYEIDKKSIHLIFDLLPKLQEQKVVKEYYQINLDKHLIGNSLLLKKYSMNDIYEAIREYSFVTI
ncbi:MAG: hypothetical protein V1781_05450 [Bacteroidota bacterium]